MDNEDLIKRFYEIKDISANGTCEECERAINDIGYHLVSGTEVGTEIFCSKNCAIKYAGKNGIKIM